VKSWGYIDNDQFRTVSSLLHELIDIVSKNGCLLLNIGPRSDGTIPQEAQDILLGMGKWLDVNGEAIYGTRPWSVSGEGPTKTKSGSFSDHKEHPFTARDIRSRPRATRCMPSRWAGPTRPFTSTQSQEELREPESDQRAHAGRQTNR
jgi:alpha-L-fucosidase